jgi:hypothetical protein
VKEIAWRTLSLSSIFCNVYNDTGRFSPTTRGKIKLEEPNETWREGTTVNRSVRPGFKSNIEGHVEIYFASLFEGFRNRPSFAAASLRSSKSLMLYLSKTLSVL